MFSGICTVQIIHPLQHVLDHAGFTAPTGQHVNMRHSGRSYRSGMFYLLWNIYIMEWKLVILPMCEGYPFRCAIVLGSLLFLRDTCHNKYFTYIYICILILFKTLTHLTIQGSTSEEHDNYQGWCIVTAVQSCHVRVITDCISWKALPLAIYRYRRYRKAVQFRGCFLIIPVQGWSAKTLQLYVTCARYEVKLES